MTDYLAAKDRSAAEHSDTRSACPRCGEWRDSPIADCASCGWPDPLGVPGYAGAKGAVPEPQEPTTEAGRYLLLRLQTRDTRDNRPLEAHILDIEAEARAAAPPDIDVERLASEVLRLRGIYKSGNKAAMLDQIDDMEDMARRLASPDATRREPSGE